MKIVTFYLSLATLLLVFPPYLISQEGLNQRVANLSEQIAKEMTQYQKTTIAVVEFADLRGNITDFGRFLAEELITRLYQTKKFKVIERQLLNQVIGEQKLSLKGLVDPSSAKQLGKLLGVDAIASGTITDLAQSLRVNARLISTETGEIFAVASTEIFKDESVIRLMAAGATTATSDTRPLASATAASKTAAQRVVAREFIFELKDWKLSGETLTLNLVVINDNPEQRQLAIGPGHRYTARLFDESGNVYYTNTASLANIRTDNIGNVRVSLIPQVPT